MSTYLSSNLQKRLEEADDHRCAYCFMWDESGVFLVGLTPVGRATIIALKLNNPVIVAVRYRWVRVGWHPPEE